MATYDEFKTDVARQSKEIIIECHAVEGMFKPEFSDMPQELQTAFKDDLTIPYHGGGVPGMWCIACRFSEIESD